MDPLDEPSADQPTEGAVDAEILHLSRVFDAVERVLAFDVVEDDSQ